MPDIASIAAVITSVKNATDLARILKDSTTTLSDAENKLRLAGMMSELADAKIGLADLRQTLEDRDSEIQRLNKVVQLRAELSFKEPFYYQSGDKTPFCSRCWEKESRCLHVGPEQWLGKSGWYGRICPDCKVEYKTRDESYSPQSDD